MRPAVTVDELSGPSATEPARRAAVPARSRSRVRTLISALGVAAALAGSGYWYATRGIESTDDAQVDADMVAVPARIGGTVAHVSFRENQLVHAGDVLAEIDDTPLRAKLAQAEASLAAAQASALSADADAELAAAQAFGNRAVAQANLRTNAAGARASSDEIQQGLAEVETAKAKLAQAELDLQRAHELVQTGAFARAQRDQAQTARDVAAAALAAAEARVSSLELMRAQAQSRVAEASAKLTVSDRVETLVRQANARAASARAQVDTARAARDLAALDLSYARILAPNDGVVSKKSINEGQSVASGQTIVQLVPKERWVTANFKETQVAEMKPGQPVEFTADAYPGRKLEGEVQSFSGATGARFTLLPPDNASGNFTKVVQRIPVRIRIHDVPQGVELRPGMSVNVHVDTDAARAQNGEG